MQAEQVAVVTGAARGMGVEIARRLGSAGHRVAMLDTLEEALADAVQRLRSEGIDARGIPLDLADDTQISKLPESLADWYDDVGILVNNAAISPKHDGRSTPAAQVPLAEWEQVLRINLTAPFRMIQTCLLPMRARRRGRIINMSSRAGRSPGGVAGASYVTSKSGLLGLTRAFAKELAAEGITVNAIAPGRIETPMSSSSPPEVLARVMQTIPVARFGTPQEVAAMVAYLASADAGFVTGATFDINGGVLMI